ncbi:MAG: VOC family protein [Defluviitaleaceae bacterium]|nr:VOC family protein [Defluviitaleaceae bacterium]
MLIPAVGFGGNCDEAISYYKEVLGAEVKTISYFRDAPTDIGMDAATPPNFVMYSEVSIYGTTFMMSDGFEKPPEGFWMQLSFDTAEEVTSIYNKLAESGEVVDALGKQFWASLNGNVKDRFGIEWNVLTNE